MPRRPFAPLARRAVAATTALALATQPLGADAAFYFRNVATPGPAGAPGTTTPSPQTDPVRGNGTLAVYAAYSARARPGVPFALKANAQNPSGAVHWDVIAGSLPPGVALDAYAGTLTGTPADSAAGTYAGIVVRGTDAAGNEGSTQPIAIQVVPRPAVTVAASTSAATGQPLSIVPQVANVLGSQNWTVNGAIPAGLNFDAGTGAIVGSSLQGGTVSGLTLTVVDSDGARGTSAPFSITVTSSLSIAGLNPTYGARLNKVAPTIQPSIAGASGQVTWTLASGTLPPGMTLDFNAGSVTGVPTRASTYDGIALKATDAAGSTVASAPFSIAVGNAPVVSLSPLAFAARNGTAIAVTPSVSGVIGQPRWILNGGTLPAGLAFDINAGTITGSPTATAQLSGLTMTVVDLYDGSSATTQPFSLSTLGAVKLAPVGSLTAEVGQPFTYSPPAASNIAGTPSWSIGGALPAGLTVDPATGTISGTPTAATASPLAARFVVKDGFDGASATSNDFPISVLAPGTFAVGALASSYVAYTGQPFQLTPSLLGAKPPAIWVASALPSWATFDNSTGAIAGTPGAPEASQTIQLTAQDSTGKTATSTPFTLTTPAGLALTYGPGQATPGQAFVLAPSVSGAQGTPAFSLASGTLPDGLALDPGTGRISGTTFASGTYPVSVTVKDSALTVRSNTFTISVPASAYSATIPAQPAGQPFKPFSVQATTSGFSSPTTWSVVSGTLPKWSSLNTATGVVSGTPDATGYLGPFVLQAADASGNTARTNPFTVTVSQAPVLSATMQSVTVDLGTAVSAVPVASNSQGTPSWALTSGTLPAGLSFNPGTGAITGTPTAVASVAGLVLTVADASGSTAATAPFGITVNPAAPLTVSIKSTALAGTLGQLFASAAPDVASARNGAVFSLVSGTLPAWATLDAGTGVISGTPAGGSAVATTSGLVLQVTDGDGRSARTPAFSIQIARVPLTASNANGFATHPGIAYSGLQPTASNALGTVSWTISPALPAGLTLNASTGAISGTIQASAPVGPVGYVLTATDSFDNSTAQSNGFTIEVYGTPVITLPSALSIRYGVFGSLKPSVSSVAQPVRWALAAGTLPQGLALDPATGAISGTPSGQLTTTNGLKLAVTDAQGFTGTSAAFGITVNNSIQFGFARVPVPAPPRRVTVPWTSPAPIIAGAIGTVTYQLVSGSVAPGMAFSTSTGQVSGTATATYSGTVTIKATDATGETATSAPLDVSIGPAPSIVQADIAVRIGAPVQIAPAVSNVAVNPYTQTYSLTLNGGPLPAGLSLGYMPKSTAYAIQGTPAAVGSVSNLVLKASDNDGAVGTSAPFSVTVTPGISISGVQAQAYSGRVGNPFATPVTPSVGNAKGTVTWSMSVVPGGMTFDPASGKLSGTPTSAYTGGATLTAVDASDGATAKATVNLDIAPAIQVLNVADLTIHAGTDAATAAPAVVDRSGASWTFSSVGSALPAFAALNASTGVVSLRAPTVGSTTGIKLQATNTADQSSGVSSPFAINVVPLPAVSGVATSYTARLGFPFTSVAPSLNNAIGAVAWSIGNGQLPAWATLNPTTGVISGTPSGAASVGNTAGLVLVGTDAAKAAASSPGFTIGVFAQPAITLASSNASGQLRVGDTYTLTPSVTGVAGTASWATNFSSGTGLPQGLALTPTTGVVGGTVLGTGAATFALVLTDSADGSTSTSASTQLVASPALQMAAIPDYSVHANQTYVSTPAKPATGTVGTPSYTLTPANVPPGMNPFDGVNGVLSGIPTGGSGTYTVTVTDPFDGRTAKSSFNLTVVGPLAFSTQPTDTNVTLGSPVSIAPAVQNALGTASYALLQNGTAAPNALSACTNLSFSATTGSITGTPTATCSVSGLTISATDSSQTATSNQFAVTVAAPSVTLDPNAVPMALQEGGTGTVQATTNLPNPTWTLANAPAGSTVSNSGLVTIYGGDVIADANTTVTVKATSGSYSDSKSFALSVRAANAAFGVAQVKLRTGSPFTNSISTNMAAPGSWTIASSPSDISGLSISGSTVSGTPPVATGASNLVRTLTATYTAAGAPQGATAAAAVATGTLTVYPALAFAAAPANASLVPGQVASVPAPQVNGAVGTLAYALMQGGTDISASLGAAGNCPGLTFSTATGAIGGTSTKNCALTGLSLAVSDPGSPGTVQPSSATSGTFSLTAQTTMAFTGQPGSPTVIQGAIGNVTATVGGTPYAPVTWSVVDASGSSASVPAWLTASNCTAATCSIGFQTNASIPAGTYPATGAYYLKATDSAGTTATSSAFAVTIQVSPVTASVATSSYASVVGFPTTTGPVTASGGATPYAYTLQTVSGTAPATVGAFNADGSFTFTPSAAGTWTYRVNVASGTDATNNASTGLVTVTTTAQTATTSGNQTFTPGTAVTVSLTTNLPNPTWSVASGALPPWMALTGSTLAGNAASVSSQTAYTFALKATSGTTSITTASVTLTNQVPTATLGATSVNGTATTAVRTGQSVTASATTTLGGTSTWSGVGSATNGGSPASDVTFVGVTGGIATYTPTNTTTASYVRYLRAQATANNAPSSGAVGTVATASQSITVYPELSIATPSNQTLTLGSSANVTASATGVSNTSGGSWTLWYPVNGTPQDISSGLGGYCPGLSYSKANGSITGTPSGNCNLQNVYHTVYDAGNGVATMQKTAQSTPFNLGAALTGQAYLLSSGSGTFTLPKSNMTGIRILMIGGGSSGGRIGYAGNTYSTGGASGYATYVSIPNVTSNTITYAVGAAGAIGWGGTDNGAAGGASSVTVNGTTYTAAGGNGPNGGSGGGTGTGGRQYAGGVGGANGGGVGGTGQGTTGTAWSSFGNFKTAIFSNGASNVRSTGSGLTGHVGGCGGGGINVSNVLVPSGQPALKTNPGGAQASPDWPCYQGYGYGAGGGGSGTSGSYPYPSFNPTGGIGGMIVIEWDSQ